MELIGKAAVVAEIKKRRKDWQYGSSVEAKYKKEECDDILSLFNALEVKEVNLEKIINDYFKDWKFDDELDIMVKPNNYSVSFTDLKEIAKHFYELGMTVSNKA